MKRIDELVGIINGINYDGVINEYEIKRQVICLFIFAFTLSLNNYNIVYLHNAKADLTFIFYR